MVQGYACTHPSWVQEIAARGSQGDKPDLAA
jgi:hypothetical protein